MSNGAATDPTSATGGTGKPDTGVDPHNIEELTQFIQNLLQQTQDRFQTMSDQIIKRIDDMGRRIDDLEQNIGELMTQAGMDDAGDATKK